MTVDNRLRIAVTGQLDLKATEKQIIEQLKKIKKQSIEININFRPDKLNQFTDVMLKQVLNYEQLWAKALVNEEKQREQVFQTEQRNRRKIEQLQTDQQQKEQKAAQDYTNAWNEALKNRELREERLNQRLSSQESKAPLELSVYKDRAKYDANRLLQTMGKSVDQKALSDWSSEVQRLNILTPKLQQEMARLDERFRQISTSAMDAKQSSNSFTERLGNGLKTIAQQAAQILSSTIIEIDAKLIEMSKVLSTDSSLSELMGSTVKLANTYGYSLTEAQNALIEFGKAGYEAEQALQLTNATLLGASVTGLQTGKMAEYLTGTLTQFNLSAEDSSKVLDKLTEVDKNFGISSIGLAQSITIAGASAQNLGVTLDELMGMTTAIGEVTKDSGNVIGNALKTAFTQLDKEAAQNALASIGVAVRDVNGEMRSATEIYADVASQWDLMTKAQKEFVAEALAGKNQVTRMTALLENWGTVGKTVEASQNSLGSSMEENRKYMQSLASALDGITTAGQELAFSIGESGLRDAMYGILKVTTTLIRGITELLPYIMSWQTGVTGLSLVILSFIPRIGQTIPLLGSLAAAVKGLGSSFLALLANPVVLATTAIVGIGAAIVYAMGKHREYVEELKKLEEAATGANARLKEIEDTMNVVGSTKTEQIMDYSKSIDNLEKVKAKLLELQNAQKEEDEYYKKLARINPRYPLIRMNNGIDPGKFDQEYKDYAQTAGINILAFKKYEEALSAVDQKLQNMNGNIKVLKNNNLSEVFDTEGRKINELTQLLERMNNKQGVTATQAKELTDKYADLGPSLHLVGDKYYFTSEKVEELIGKSKYLIKQSYDNAKTEVQNREKALLDLVNSYDTEINKIEELISKRDQLNNSIAKKVANKVANTVITGTDGSKRKLDASEAKYLALGEQAKIEKEIDKRLEENEKSNEELEKYRKLSEGLGKTSQPEVPPKRAHSSSSASSISRLSNDAKELLRIETELSTLQNKRQLLSNSSSEYRNSLQQEKDLQQQKLNLLIKEYEQVTKTKVQNGKLQKDRLPAKLSDDALKQAYDLQKEINQLQDQLHTLSFDDISSSLSEFADENNYLEARMKIVQERMASYSKTSQEYRDAIEEENNHLKLKQDNLHREAEFIRIQLANGKLSAAQREELTAKVLELQAAWLNLQNNLDTKKLEQINSILGEQKNKTDDLSKSIELSKAKMDAMVDSNSEQYFTEYANYLQLMLLKKESLQEEISLREKQIQQNLQNIDLVRQYKIEIVDLQMEQIRLQEAMNNASATKIIDVYKKIYEEQKNTALKALDSEEKKENERHKKKLERIEEARKKKEKAIQKEIEAIEETKKAEDERHKAAMDALDDELNKFNEAIGKRLQLIDRNSSEREYDNELERLQSERQKLQEQMNLLALDDSYEAKLRQSELTEQLASKDKEIEDLNYKRSTELRKENLEDQREAYEKDIDSKKKAEQAKYDAAVKKLEFEKTKLDQQLTYYKEYYDKLVDEENRKNETIIANLAKEREETERHFNELIADEMRYADMRKAILSGNLAAMQEDLSLFEQFVKDNMSTIGNSIAQNLLAKIEESKKAIETLNHINVGGSVGNSNGTSGSNDNYSKYQATVKDIVNAKGKWTEANTAGDKAGEKYWADYAKPLYDQLPAELANELRRSKYDEALNLYNKYYKGKYHDGGIVEGNSDSLTELVNKMFNLSPNEGFAKVLKGELWTTPKNIAQNFIPNLKNLMSSMTPIVNLGGASSGSGDIHVNLNIERFTGTETDYNKFKNFVMDSVIQANKKRGR